LGVDGYRSDQVEDLSGGISLEAADDLTAGLALLGAAFVIRLGAGVVAQAGEDDAVQGRVRLPVAAAGRR
jgi:hypothetical protein